MIIDFRTIAIIIAGGEMYLAFIKELFKYRFVNIVAGIYYRLYFFYTRKYRKPCLIFKLQQITNLLVFIIKKRIKKINNIRKNNSFRRSINSYDKQKLKVMVDDYEYLLKLYLTLIDDMIIKYICVDECGQFRQLFIHYSENTNYDYKKIKSYLKRIKELYAINKGYYFICDLCSVNLDCGDIIYLTEDEVNYVELKDYKSSKKELLLNAINNKKMELNDKYDKEQYTRINKQFERHRDIDFNFSNPFFGDCPRTVRKIFRYKGFITKLKNDLKNIEKKLYIETKVDDCIKYIIINNRNIKTNFAEEIKLSRKMNNYITDGISCFTYDEFLFDTSVYRPYMLKWTKKEYKKIIKTEVSIYIKINIEKLLKKFEKYGFQIYSIRVKNRNDTAIIYNGKQYFFKYKNEDVDLGNMVMYSIPAMFYTSCDVIRYYSKVSSEIVKLKQQNIIQ